MFTKLSWIIAIVALAAGLLQLASGIALATGLIYYEVTPSYAKAPGQMIDRAVYTILGAVALGMLSEISRRLVEIRDKL